MALKFLMLSALVAGAVAGPIYSGSKETQCARSCPTDSRSTSYDPGQTYEYGYVSSVKTNIPGTTEEHSSLHMAATVHLEVITACDMAIRLSEVSLQDSDPGNLGRRNHVENAWDFKRALQEKAVRFALVDGRVEDVCPEEGEETWVLNIKRAIISALQNSMVDFTRPVSTKETDVVGDCDVTYEPAGSTWKTYKVKKTKDMLTCTRRHDASTIFQAMSYQVPSKIQSLPILKSTHECDQEVLSSGQISSSSCREIHILRPFSKEGSGATTEAEFSLTFKRAISGTQTSDLEISRRTDLVFEHVPVGEEQTSTKREAMETMRKMCEQTRGGVRPETPALFAQLVKDMKKLDFESLSIVRSKIPCDKANKFFQDALPTLSSPASLGVMRDMILSNEVTESQAERWLTSLAFIPKPTRDMIEEVTPLLTATMPLRKSALSVSALVHSYCQQNPECHKTREVRQVIRALEEMIGSCTGDHNKIIMALKAIGNMGHAEKLVPVLNKCLRAGDTETRVAAIGAFRRMACTAERDEVVRIFEDVEEDSEIRINAYLALMNCPTYDIIRRVRQVLEREQVNQVGSFIWTHLTNLMETSSPLKQTVRYVLENEDLKKTFDMDKRKFSRNVEWSIFSEMINTGAMVESNLIWSTKSFIPRSATVNLTVDIFGQSVNLFEVGGRAEGLDGLLESLFGDHTTPGRKSNKFNHLDNKFRVSAENEPKGSYFLRIFGNEIRYDDFHGFDTVSIMDKLNYLQWLIDLANEHDWEYTKSFVFLDTEMHVPTAVGLPLCLSLDGTAIMDLKMKGKMDLRNLAAAPRSLDITGTVRPSAAIQINGEMYVDAFVAKTGLRMVNTFHTSTLMDGTMVMKEGKLFNFEFNMPNEKMEIFNADSKFFITYRKEQREQNMITDGRMEKEACIGGPMVKALGVELCGQISLPRLTKSGAPWMPFTGPSSVSLVLNKRDSFDKYVVEARIAREKVAKGIFSYSAIVKFDTPDSRIDRQLLADFDLDRQARAVHVNIRSPWKKANFTASWKNTEVMKSLDIKAIIDDTLHYTMIAELKSLNNKMNTKIFPRFEVAIPDRQPIRFGGTILYRDGKRADVDLSLENLSKQPMTIKGEVNYIGKGRQKRYETDLAVRVPYFKGSITSFVDSVINKNEMIVSTNTEIKYRSPAGRQAQISLSNRYHMQRAGNRMTISMNGAVATSLYPKYDTDYTLELTKDTGSMRYSYDIGFSKDKPKRITMAVGGTYDTEGEMKKIGGQGTFRFPYMGWDYEARLEHEHGPHELKSEANIRYGPKSDISGELSLKKESATPLKLSAGAKIKYPGREMVYTHLLEEKSPKAYQHDLIIKFDKYDQMTLTSVYKMLPKHEITATLKVPGLKPISMEASIKPDLTDFSAHGLTEYDGNTFSIDGAWTHKGNIRNFNTRGNFELSYPERKIILEGEAKRIGNTISSSIETKWDASNNSKKKFSISLMTKNTQTPSFQIKTQWFPNQFMEMSGSLKNEKTGWYSATRDMEASLRFLSSFPGYKKIDTTFKHEQTATMIRTNSQTSWSDKKIEAEFNMNWIDGWSKLKSDISLTTPFANIRSIMVETQHDLTKGIESNSMVQWNSNKMELSVTGQNDPLRGEIKFTSPFEGFEHISLSGNGQIEPLQAEIKFISPINGMEKIILRGKHECDGQRRNAELTASWGRNRAASIIFNMNHARSGWYISNDGTLTITMPIRNAKKTSLIWNHNNDQTGINSHAEIIFNGDRSVFDLEGQFKSRYELKASLQTPYISDVSFDFENQGDMTEMKTKASATWANEKIEIDNEFSYIEMEAFVLKTTVRSPWKIISLDLNNKVEGGEILTLNKLMWGTEETSIQGDFKLNFPTFEGLVKVITPYSTKDIEVYASNKNEQGVWVMNTNVMFEGETQLEGEFKLGMSKVKKLRVEIKTQLENLRHLIIDLQHKGKWNKFNTRAKISHNMLSQDISFDFDVVAVDLPNLDAELTFKSPITMVEFIKSRLSHKVTGRNTHQADFKLEIPYDTFTVSHTLDMDGPVYSSKFTGTCQHDSVEWDVVLNVAKGLDVTAYLSAPYIEDKSLKFTYEGSITDFTNEIELVSGQQKITSNVQFSLGSNNIEGRAMFTAPNAPISIQFKGEITPSVDMWNSIKGEASFDFNGNRMSSSGEMMLTDDSFNLRKTVSTTFTYLKDLEISINHRGPMTRFENDMTIVCNGQTITGSSKFNMNRKKIIANAELITPFTTLRTINVNVQHTGPITDFHNSVAMRLNGKGISAESAFRMAPMNGHITIKTPTEYSIEFNNEHESGYNFKYDATVNIAGDVFKGMAYYNFDGVNIDTSVAIETPIPGYRNIGISYKHKGPMNDMTCDLTANLEEKTITAFHHLKMNGNAVDYSLTIETPFESFRRIGATFNHKGQLKNFNTELRANLEDMEVTGTCSFKMTNLKTTGALRLQTPFQTVGDIDVNFMHKGKWNNFQNELVISYNDKTIDVSSSFKSIDELTATLNIKTPYSYIRTLEISLRNNGDLSRFDNELRCIWNGKEVSGHMAFSKTGTDMETTISISTPFDKIKDFVISLKNRGHLTAFSSEISISLNGQTISGAATYTMTTPLIEGTLTLDTPFAMLKNFEIRMKHVQGQSRFNNELIINLNGKSLSGHSSFSFEGNDLEFAMDIDTPFELFKSFDMTMKHSGEIDNFNNELTMSLNGRSVSGSCTFTLRDGKMDLGVDVNTPFSSFRNWNLNIQTIVKPVAFTQELSTSLNGQSINFRTFLKALDSNLEWTMTIDTPFDIIKNFDLNIKHNGDLRNFNNELSLTLNDKTVDGSSNFILNGMNMEGTLYVNTPFKTFRTFELAATHKGRMTNFDNEFVAKLNGQKLAFGTDFNKSGKTISGTISAESPITGPIEISFKHNGDYNKFNNEISGKINEEQVTVNTNFMLADNRVEGSFSLNTPYQESLPDIELTFNHQGSLFNFNQDAELTFNGKRFSVSNMFKKTDSLVANVELTMPIGKIRNIVINFNHGGYARNFKSDGFVQVNNVKYAGNVEVDVADINREFHIAANIEIPEKYSIVLDHQGPPMVDCITDLTITFDGRQILGHMTVKMEGDRLDASLTINTPFRNYNNINAQITHEGGWMNFKQDSRIEYFGNVVTHKCEFSLSNKGIDGIFEFTSPCPLARSFSVKFNHIGKIRNFKNGFMVELNGERFKGSSELKLIGGKKRGEITVKIPEEYSIEFIHKGDINDFTNVIKATIVDQKVNANTAWKRTDTVIDGSFVLRSPYKGYKNFNIEFTHKNKKMMSTTGIIKTPFSNFKEMNFEVTHEGTPRDFKFLGKLNLPIRSIRSVGIEVNHRGRLANFASNAAFEYNSNKYTGDVAFRKVGTKIDTSASIQTPHDAIRNAAINLNHDGPLTDFTCTGSAELNGNKCEYSLVVKKGDTIEISGSVSTPFEAVKDMTFNINHRGTITDFTTNANAELNGKPYSGSLNFKKDGSTIETSGSSQGFHFNVNHNGHMKAFTTRANIKTPFRQYKSFGVELNHEGNLNRFRSGAKIDTPFEILPTTTVSVNHRGGLGDFETHGTVDYSGKRFEGEATYKNAGPAHRGTMMIRTPFQSLRHGEIKMEHTNEDTMQGKIEATHNGVKQIDADYAFGMRPTKTANINIRAPRSLVAAVNIANDGPQLSGDANLNIEGSPYAFNFGLRNQDGMHELTVQTEIARRTLSLITSFKNTEGRIAHKSEIQWGNGPNKKLSYEIEASRTRRNRQVIYDGIFKVNSRIVNFEGTFSHKVTSGRRYLTDIKIQRIGIRSDIIFKQPNELQTFFTMRHPSFVRDVVLAIDVNFDPAKPSYDGKINLEYADQKFEVTGKFADESSSRNELRYTAEAHLTHPASDLDVMISSHVTNNRETMGGDIDVKYMMSRTKQVKNTNLRAEINKLREELNMQILSPIKRVTMTGRRTMSDAMRQHFIMSGNVGDNEVNAELDVNRAEPSFDVILRYREDGKLHIYGKYLDPTTVQIEAVRENDGSKTQDTELSLRLVDKNILAGRAYFRPEIVSDVKAMLSGATLFGEEWEILKETLEREHRYKKTKLMGAISPIVQVYFNMYSDNVLYLRDIIDKMSEIKENINNVISARMEIIREQVAKAMDNVQELMKISRNLWISAKQYWIVVSDKYAEHKALMHSWIMDKIDEIRNHPKVQEWIDTVTHMRIEDYTTPLRFHVNRMHEKYKEYIDMAKDMMENIRAHPAADYAVNYAQQAANNAKWVVEYYDLDDSVKAAWNDLRQTGWETLKDEAMNWAKSKLALIKASWTVWAPRNGDFQFEIHLPFQLRDLRSLPSLHIERYIKQMWDIYEKYVPKFQTGRGWSIWDTVYTYKPSSNPMDWIPPFKTHATISGAQHFMTFDRKFYEFAGECSYLLARDFIDGNFSVVVNYDTVKGKMTKKSITVHSDDVEVEILPDFKINVNGKQTELPYVNGHTVIKRRGHAIQVDNEHGVTVICDLYHDRCTVNVTGWYYGKTGGLFGTYDNEPSNDFLTSERRIVTGTEEFTNSWATGRRCRAVNHAREAVMDPQSQGYKECAKYFKDTTSLFRICFKQVDPKYFMAMCINEMSSNTNGQSTCDIAAFYVEECKAVGVPVRMPKDCVRCELPSGEVITEGEEVTISDREVPQSADIVFVVSHEKCNKEVNQHLVDLVEQMERNLKSANLKNNRYGFVGFAGPGVLGVPHSHTVDGQLFAPGHKFGEFIYMENIETAGEDPLGALKFAAGYPFRTGVSKTIILVPCEACVEKSVGYSEMQQLLLSRDIRLHVLMQHNFKLRASSTKTSYIFGVDRKGLFTPKHVSDKQLIGDEDLRKQVIMPKDLCTALSEETDGSVFSITQLLESRSFVQKRFRDVMTRVAVKKASPSACQICQCVTDEYGVGTSVCRNCMAPEPIDRPWTFGEDEVDFMPEASEMAIAKKPAKKMRSLKLRKSAKGKKKAKFIAKSKNARA